MSILVSVEYSVGDDRFLEIEAACSYAEKFDANFQGQEIEVRRGEFTCVDSPDDEIAGCVLLNTVNHIAYDQEGF